MDRKPQVVLPPITDPTVHKQIDRLAQRYVDAGGLGMEILSMIGAKCRVADRASARFPPLAHGWSDPDGAATRIHGSLALAQDHARPW